jgi:type IV secretion system protein VirD4
MSEDNFGFERSLKKELRRGVRGETDKLSENVWAVPKELGPKWGYGKDGSGILLGKRDGQLIGWNDDRHLLTVAGTRAGKGASLIIPNLLLYGGSVLAIDPKGELAYHTGRRRKELGRLVVLDPFEENGRFASGHYNPLDELDPKGKEVIDEAGAIAQALVFYSGKGDPHWSQAAHAAVRAIILMVLTLGEKQRNLVTVRDILNLTHATVMDAKRQLGSVVNPGKEPGAGRSVSEEQALIWMMKGVGEKFEGVVEAQGKALESMADKERQSVLSEARTQTQFLDSPKLREVLKESSFRLRDLKRERLSVFLCLPARHMDTHDRWLRVIINLAIGALEPKGRAGAGKPPAGPPVLLLLEEFPVLKHMEKLETAAGLLAGAGVRLWVVVQDLGQIEQHYGKAWETFIANAGAITAFSNADLRTQKYLSEKLGSVPMLIRRDSGASSSALLSGARPLQEDLRDTPLLHPDELGRVFDRSKMRLLMLAAGQPPLIVERLLYFKDPMFGGMYDA